MSTELADLLNTIEEALVEVDRLRAENRALRKRVEELDARIEQFHGWEAAEKSGVPHE